ncbi:hypothetical protein VNO80_22899 [Phaseolus coccineus]|uniref:Xylanase inhibitor C-terminal domain-containing protein n=1 Tax=Phaseolus coccineus TaxID=3886 RepID=A0AAN9M5Q6_PHACN
MVSPIGPITSISVIPTVLTPCLAFSRTCSAVGSRFHFSFHMQVTIVQCPSTIPHPRHPPSSPSVAPSPISPPRRFTALAHGLSHLLLLPLSQSTPVHTILKGLVAELSKAIETLSIYNKDNKILVLVNCKSMKMKRVSSVAPFGACFSSRMVGKTVTGSTIDLFLKGEVEWRIYEVNSVVKVNKKVHLGFVDGSLELEGPAATSIVIGGYQMEDNLLEFDLASSKIGFSSSLLLHNATCSHFRVLYS